MCPFKVAEQSNVCYFGRWKQYLVLADIVAESKSGAFLFFYPSCDCLNLLLFFLYSREIGGRDAAVF
jgi:hypothetical protein